MPASIRCPAGKDAAKLAEQARTRMQAEVDDRRTPRTRATVAQLMEKYLDVLQIEDTTRAGYEGHVRRHINPLLGHLQVGRVDGETLDGFYRELRRCRKHCRGERSALRWSDIDFATSVIDIDSSIGQIGRRVWEKDTTTHQRPPDRPRPADARATPLVPR